MSESPLTPVPREHYIPLRKTELIQRLCQSPALSDDDRDGFARFATLLDATFHHRFHVSLERLKDRYAAFADRDTFPLADGGPGTPEPTAAGELFEEFGELLAQLELIEDAGEERVRAVPIAAALQRLDAAWDGLFSYNQAAAATPPNQAA